jgi:drug/metabolite transporter (DMT)-like permease
MIAEADMPTSSAIEVPARKRRPALLRHAAIAHRRASRMDPVVRALIWSTLSGVGFVVLNAIMRELSVLVGSFETQFLRYVAGLVVMLPLVWRAGVASYLPKNTIGQFGRGAVHTLALVVWFIALPHISLAEMTAIGFTTPLFIMIGAALVFREPMRRARWVASGIGFAGVCIVVGPQLTGSGGWYTLVMLSTSPIFAASFLFTKSLTRTENAGVIVLWQAISVSLFSMPLALTQWQWPSPLHWLGFVACGLLGSASHYCLTRSYVAADISASQSVKFLDLVWAAVAGWIAFGEVPSRSTLVGGFVICASTIWIAQRERRR